MPVCEIPKGNRKQPNSHRLPGALLRLPILSHCNWLFASIRYKSLANTLFDIIFFCETKSQHRNNKWLFYSLRILY